MYGSERFRKMSRFFCAFRRAVRLTAVFIWFDNTGKCAILTAANCLNQESFVKL